MDCNAIEKVVGREMLVVSSFRQERLHNGLRYIWWILHRSVSSVFVCLLRKKYKNNICNYKETGYQIEHVIETNIYHPCAYDYVCPIACGNTKYRWGCWGGSIVWIVWETPRDPFDKKFISSQLEFLNNSLVYDSDFDNPIRSQICTCHDSSAVVTCAKLWPDWMINLTVWTTWFFTRFGQWAHKPCVEWVPGSQRCATVGDMWPPEVRSAARGQSHVTNKRIDDSAMIYTNATLRF